MTDVMKTCVCCGGVIRIDGEDGKSAHLQDGTWWRDTAGRNVCLSRRLVAKDDRLSHVLRALRCALNRLKRYEDHVTNADLWAVLDGNDIGSVPDREHAASKTPNRDEVSRAGTQEGYSNERQDRYKKV